MINNELELAKNMISKGQYLQAIEILELLMQTDKNNKDIIFELAKSYFFFKNFDKARSLFIKLLDTHFSLYSSLFLAKLEIQNNKLDKALDILLKEKSKSYNVELLLEIAHVYELLKDVKNKISIYEQILELEPNNTDLQFELFKIYRVENTEKALTIANDLLKKDVKLTLRRKNTLLNFVEYITGETTLKSFPQMILVAPSSKCNLQCVMCNSYKHNWTLSSKLEEELISLFPYIQDITWYGGEPLLYKNIDKLLDLAHKDGVNQYIITNGLLLNDKMIDKLIEYKVITHISIDAPNKDLYEKIRKGANFDILIRNLENIKNKISNKDFDLFLNCVVMQSNYKYLEDMIIFASKFKFKKISFLVLDDKNDYPTEMLDYLKNKIDIYYNLANKYGIEIESPLLNSIQKSYNVDNNIENINAKKSCAIPWISFYIQYSGETKFSCICNIFSTYLKENKSILEIWNSKEAIETRKIIVNNEMDKYCKKECLYGLFSQEYRCYYKKNIE